MDSSRIPAMTGAGATKVDDLSSLAWVIEELRRSLDNAHKALRRFVKESEALSGSDVDAVDPSVLRTARQQIHQGVGALELVGLPEAAGVLRASEAAVQRFVAKPGKLGTAEVEAIERASFALLDYVQRLLAGKPMSPLALFPQYQAVQTLAGADRVHPADLWAVDWRWRDLPAQTGVTPRAADADAHTQFEQALLVLMRGPVAPAAARMSELCASLGAGAQSLPVATLWKLAAAFFEALAQGLLPSDVFTKRVASRLLAQLRSLEKGESDVSERLAQDLLFFCAQSRTPDASHAAPRLLAAREAYGLTQIEPVDYNQSQLGRFDPTWVAQAIKRVATARDSWSAVAGGEMHRLSGLVEQFSLVGDSLKRLYPSGELLADELQQAVSLVVQAAVVPPPPLAMEVATSVLYLEASLEDADFDHPEQAERVGRLAQRISLVRAGQTPPPLEAWMEELYRRVSDRQTMGTVVQELHTSLSEIEKAIDQFFRNPSDRQVLVPVPAQLSSMRGVLSVLGLDQASQAVLCMRDDVEGLLTTDIDPQGVVQSGTFDRLAGNVSALGFLINMHGVQPQAKSLFYFDAQTGRLTPLMGRAAPVPPPSVEPRLIEQAQSVAESAGNADVPAAEVARELEQLSHDAQIADQPALQATVQQAQAAIEEALDSGNPDFVASVRGQLTEALQDFVSTASDPVGLEPEVVIAPPSPQPLSSAPTSMDTDLGDDPEMREIFLEEAREVVDTGEAACADLAKVPSNMEQLTSLRRAFHTLKGSSRMVGLKEFGEAGWAAEQVLNGWLASQKPAEPQLLDFATQTLAYMRDWVEAIANQQAGAYVASPVKAAADALNAGQSWPPIALPQAAVAAPAEPVLPKIELNFADETPAAEAPVAEAVPEIPVADTTVAEAESPDALALPELTEVPEVIEAAPPIDAPAAPELRFELDLSALDEPQPVAPAIAEPMASPATDTLDFEFRLDGLAPEAASVAEPVAEAAPEAERSEADTPPVDEPPAATETTLILHPPVEAVPAADFGETVQVPVPDVLETPEVVEAAAAPEAEGDDVDLDLSVPADIEVSLVQPEPEPEVDASPLEAEPAPPEDDQVKVVGPLRIGIPLFNIYLNEADELSRRLTTEVAEWGMELHRPVGEMPIALAHSLAGNSATVGFTDLSQLARSVEHALMRQQKLGNGTPEDGRLFVDAAEEIRRLLHQFAAGFLKTPSPELLQRLAEHEISAAARLEALSQNAEAESVDAEADAGPVVEVLADAPLIGEPPEPVLAEVASETSAPESLQPAEDIEPEAAAPAPTPSAPMPLAADSAFAGLGQAELKAFTPLPTTDEVRTVAVRADAPDTEDDIDAIDAVDAELFPIFEEEAEELLPALSSGLRDWARRPADRSAAAGCMRTLHTLKGGARLAGAMRLGEMAHRLETSIEHLLAQDSVHSSDVDALQARADSLSTAFETLRSRDAQAYAEAGAAVEQEIARSPEPEPLLPTPELAPLEPVAVTAAAVAPVEVAPEAAPAVPAEPPSETARETAAEVTPAQPAPIAELDWSRFLANTGSTQLTADKPQTLQSQHQSTVRVRAPLLERLVNQAGEVSITRSRIESEVSNIRASLSDLTDNLERLRGQLRDIEFQAELQMTSRLEAAKAAHQTFDPLESDRFTRFQELTRMMAESVNDVATVQRTLQRTLETTEDELVAQGRLTRDLQDDLLRTRMVEFEGQSDRLYRVVRQAAKETGKHVRLDIVGGSIEIDRGVLERMMGAFEHLLRNCVTHGIESPEVRTAAGKDATGTVLINVRQEGNEVSVEFRDDGAGLNLQRIRDKGLAMGLLRPEDEPTDAELANLIFTPGFSTADTVTELAGRGVGMDVVRSEVNAMGGRIETATALGQGTSFRLVLPLTTAVTQVVMLRCGDTVVAVPSTLVEIVRRATAQELDQAYETGSYTLGDRSILFFWLGALLQLPPSTHEAGRMRSIVVVRSAQQRIALHVDEVLGNQEVVVKNLGPQLSRLPGLAGMTLLASGSVALIYNPVALATLYGESARAAMLAARHPAEAAQQALVAVRDEPAVRQAPLVLVVDDSLTVRRVTQRLLVREGYRVTLAKDGIEALERLAEERPEVVLSDIEMPRMDGFDLARNIRGDAKLRDLPIIMITSRIAQKHRDYAAELGVDHYLGKPYSEEDLLALIARYTTANEVTA